MSHILFTPHAIDRFIERHVPGITYDEAASLLRRHARGAVRLKCRSVCGDPLARMEIAELQLSVVFVLKRDGDVDVAMTILPASAAAQRQPAEPARPKSLPALGTVAALREPASVEEAERALRALVEQEWECSDAVAEANEIDSLAYMRESKRLRDQIGALRRWIERNRDRRAAIAG